MHCTNAIGSSGAEDLAPSFVTVYLDNTLVNASTSLDATICSTSGTCSSPSESLVVKMASHAIFQYIVLAIDDTHNTWTNMIVKMIILRILGSSDDKEKIGKVRPEGPPLRGKALRSVAPEEPTHEHRCIRWLSEEPTPWYFGAERNQSQVSL